MNEIIPSMLTAFVTALATKGAEAPAQTFNNAWKYVFGPLDNFLIKQNSKRIQNKNKYLESIKENTEKIPTENLQEPKLSILGPALESSKYYIDETIIRNMFAKVIAGTFDNRKNNKIHHAYVDIIKQLGSLDAKLFSKISSPFFLVTIESKILSKENTVDLLQNIYLDNEYTEVDISCAIAMSNLNRLGLINITNNIFNVKNNSDYKPIIDKLKETTYYKEKVKLLGEKNIKIYSQPCNITELGFNFREICLE